MAPVPTSVQQLVNENSPTEFLQAAEILIKFAGNVLLHPTEPKYRRIRLGNPTVESKLLTVVGAMECLFEMGFTESEDGAYLILPTTTTLSILKDIKSLLEKEKSVIEKSRLGLNTKPLQDENKTLTAGAAASNARTVQTQSKQNLQDIMGKEQVFFKKIEAQLTHVQIYEDRRLQQQARDVIPVQQLTEEAKQKLEILNQSESSGKDSAEKGGNGLKFDLQDCLVLALLNWYKNSFFKWVDAPPCSRCGDKTSMQGMVQPTSEELRWGGNRVENYRCTKCYTYTRFVRYNHPGKLLETREGRCGEWANCFTLCCRALGFEARFVLDWTDHVWTEVYSNSQKRWVHCDPCENTCDKPLLYDVGWGKKLTYVIAFSVDDIEDVTWRYVSDFNATLARRTECREDWLVQVLYNLDKKKWSAMPEVKRQVRLQRKLADLVEFLTPKVANKQNLSGRTTGSLEWRLARGELGTSGAETKEPFVFKLNEVEKSAKCFHVKYSCAKDEYCRVVGGEVTKDFKAMVEKMENIFRKVEHDWKMAYLARTEGSSSAEMQWKFDFAESGLKIDRIEVKADCSTFETGKINWTICGAETCAMLKGGPTTEVVEDLRDQTGFTVTASLRGGKGDVAWQHTQLFRQSSEDLISNPFEIKVTFL